MRYLLATCVLLLVVASTSNADIAKAGDTQEATPSRSTDATSDKPPKPEELSDAFLGEVSDGSKPAANGSRGEEENGGTLDQTLRTHTRGTP